MIKSSNVIRWLNYLSLSLGIKETAKAQLSEKAIDQYCNLSKKGLYPQLLMIRRYRSGLLYIARVR